MSDPWGMSGVEGGRNDWGGNFGPHYCCSCCGSRAYTKKNTKDLLKSRFISIRANRTTPEVSENSKGEVVCIETSNGPLTIGMRYAW
jgi:hypothetical protein